MIEVNKDHVKTRWVHEKSWAVDQNVSFACAALVAFKGLQLR